MNRCGILQMHLVRVFIGYEMRRKEETLIFSSNLIQSTVDVQGRFIFTLYSVVGSSNVQYLSLKNNSTQCGLKPPPLNESVNANPG